jgi:hypothetical protein
MLEIIEYLLSSDTLVADFKMILPEIMTIFYIE